MKNLILFFSIVFLLASCKKEDQLPLTENSGKIDLTNLKVGQKNYYKLFTGENYFDNNDYDSYEYHKDTLIVEIVSETNGKFEVQEYFTPGSASLNGDNTFPNPEDIYKYSFQIENEKLTVTPSNSSSYLESRVFFQEEYALTPIADPQVEILGWKTSMPYSEAYQEGIAASFELFGKTYQQLNVVINNQAMAVDGPGFTYVFNSENGFVRTTQVSWWTQSGFGWDLIP